MTIFTHRPHFFIHSGYVLLMTSSSIAEDLTNVCGSTNVMRARENRYLTRLIPILFPDKFTSRRVRNVVFYPSVHLHHNKRSGVFIGVLIVSSTVCSGKDQLKHQSSASLVLVRGNPPVTGGFPSQRASIAENVSIWWRHHDFAACFCGTWTVVWLFHCHKR